MPPKKVAVDKVVAEKTFGMKNKNKSKKVQNFISQVKNAAENAIYRTQKEKDDHDARVAKKAATSQKRKEEDDWLLGGNSLTMRLLLAKKKKEEEEARKAAELVDPKTIICPDFMEGRCAKGDQCKYLHDDTKSRKSAKINLYEDPRDKMEDWDLAKLQEVVNEKESKRGKMPATDIVCKFFLDAVEKQMYGWRWECPNGEVCHYRHCLPLGYVFKPRVKKTMDDATPKEEVDISDTIEAERALLVISQCTPVTPETFAAWKDKRVRDKEAQVEKLRVEAAKKAGNRGLASGVLSGRDLFKFDPTLFADDDGAAADDAYILDDEERDAEDMGGNDGQYYNDDDLEEMEGAFAAASMEETPVVAVAVPAAVVKVDKKKLVKFDKSISSGDKKKDKKDKKDKKEKKDKKDKKDDKSDKKKSKKDDVAVDESLFDDSDNEDADSAAAVKPDLGSILLW